MGLAGRRDCAGVAVVDSGAACGNIDDERESAGAAGVRESRVPLAVPRYEQESHPALVRHEDLREPDEGAPVQGTAAGCGVGSESPGLKAAILPLLFRGVKPPRSLRSLVQWNPKPKDRSCRFIHSTAEF